MTDRPCSLWTVTTLAAILGAGFGGGTAAMATLGRPMRIGDFSGVPGEPGDAAATAGPKAVIASSEHDFGVMTAGRSGSHRFRVVNEGTSPLRLTAGRSSCGCTIASLGTEAVAPGESCEVTIQWRTKGEGGRFQQQVAVLTNDPRRPEISLRISGTVVPAWRSIPASISLPGIVTSRTETASLTLLTYGRPPATLGRLALGEPGTAEFFAVESRPLTAEEVAATGDPDATGGFSISVSTQPGLPPGPLRQTIQATLHQSGRSLDEETRASRGTSADGEEEVVAEIPVEGTVTGDIAVAGRGWDSSNQSVALGQVSARTGLRTELFLTVKGPHRDSVRPRLKEVVPASLTVDIGESKSIGAGTVRRIPITLSIPPGSPPCNHLGNTQAPSGRLVLETGHPETPLLEIPVRVSIGP